MILLLAFIFVPLAEIATFIAVGERIGLWPTLAAIVVTALLGTALLRAQGFAVLRSAQASLDRGELPVAEVFDGACLLFAGALLLTPGFLTDALGFAMFVPIIRAWLGRALLKRLMKSEHTRVWIDGEPVRGRDRPQGEGDPDRNTDVIDGEFVVLGEDAPHGGPDDRDDDTDRRPPPAVPRR